MSVESPGENSITEIRLYFERDAKPLEKGEFVAFWKSLSDEEKIEFRHADLSK